MTISSDFQQNEVNPEAITAFGATASPAATAVMVSSDGPLADGVPSVSVMAIAPHEDDGIPLATMEPVPISCDDLNSERRPAIMSVTVLKAKRDDVGISIEETDDGLRISSIDPDSLFSDTPVDVGDFVLSVNQSSCEQKDAAYVARLLRRAKQTVTLVVHRLEDDPYLISTTVSKPTPESRVGIGVQIYDGALRVSSIHPGGLFAGSILNVGDKVVSICGVCCACMDSTSAIELIRQEKSTITIVTWTEEEAGVVVAAARPAPLYVRYRTFLPCLFSVFLITMIAVIVMLTSRRVPVPSSDDEDRPCRNLYGQPIPYCY